MTPLDAVRTSRPPCRSISRPTSGETAADSSSDAEKIPKNRLALIPSVVAIGTPRIAGR